MLYNFVAITDEAKKYAEMMRSSCMWHYNVKILNLFDPELQMINTKPIMKDKLK